MTIHRFIKEVVNSRIKTSRDIAPIDETPMLGTPDLRQVLGWLPLEVDVVRVGDEGPLAKAIAANS